MNIDDKGLKSAAELAANKPHGVRVKYMGGCRCMLCRAANSRYETERAAARKAGDWNGVVRALAARNHIRRLSNLGIGRRAISEACDVAESSIHAIGVGVKKNIRRRTEQKILGVTREAIADGGLIDADPTWRLINELLEEGFTKTELARRLGKKTRALQLNRFEVRAFNASKVERLYRQVMAGGEAA